MGKGDYMGPIRSIQAELNRLRKAVEREFAKPAKKGARKTRTRKAR